MKEERPGTADHWMGQCVACDKYVNLFNHHCEDEPVKKRRKKRPTKRDRDRSFAERLDIGAKLLGWE